MDKLEENIVFINLILLQNPHKHHDLPKSDKKLINGSLYEIFQIILYNEDCKYLQVTFNDNRNYVRAKIKGTGLLSYAIDIVDPEVINHFFILYNDFQQKLKKKIRKEKLKKIGI